jgi:hypothetical protein
MTKLLFVFAVLGLASVTFAGIGNAAGNCEDLLGDNIYRCEVKDESGTLRDQDCFRFNSAPTISQDFDLNVDLGGAFGCSCRFTGSFNTPTADASKEWICINPTSVLTFGGKVAGKEKISKVFGLNQGGDTFIFNCVVDPACTSSGPTAETLTVPSESQYSH